MDGAIQVHKHATEPMFRIAHLIATRQSRAEQHPTNEQIIRIHTPIAKSPRRPNAILPWFIPSLCTHTHRHTHCVFVLGILLLSTPISECICSGLPSRSVVGLASDHAGLDFLKNWASIDHSSTVWSSKRKVASLLNSHKRKCHTGDLGTSKNSKGSRRQGHLYIPGNRLNLERETKPQYWAVCQQVQWNYVQMFLEGQSGTANPVTVKCSLVCLDLKFECIRRGHPGSKLVKGRPRRVAHPSVGGVRTIQETVKWARKPMSHTSSGLSNQRPAAESHSTQSDDRIML